MPTAETSCLSFILDMLVHNRQPVLLVGSAGTSKTANADRYLRRLDEHFMYSTINLNSYTDAKYLQAIMEGSIDKRVGRIYGPWGPRGWCTSSTTSTRPTSTYGTQSPSALIRQQMDYAAWFDTVRLEKEIHDVQYLSCMEAKLGKYLKDALDKLPKLKEVQLPPPDIWCSFTGGEKYQQTKSMEHLKTTLHARLKEHNESNATMDLELFGVAMEHVCRIARIIENPRGNTMLIGVGGSGKLSLARLPSFICGYDVFQITVTSDYGMDDLKTDLKDATDERVAVAVEAQACQDRLASSGSAAT